MRKNKIARKNLISSSSREKDRLLKEAYGFSSQDFRNIRGQNTLKKKILCAGKIFQKKLLKLDPKDASAQFTATNLAAIISKEWDDPKKKSWSIGSKISRYFKSMNQLREICEVSYGNVQKIREIYPEVEISAHDIVRGITIPEKIESNMLTLFALYLTRGSLYNHGSGQFNLNARKEDEGLFKKVLGPLVNKIFNIDDLIRQSDNHKTPWLNNSYRKSRCKMDINSKAHYTFLKYVMGFPTPKENIKVPIRDSEKENYATWAGLVAGTGEFIKDVLVMYSQDKRFIETASSLANKIGFSPKICNKTIRFKNNQEVEHSIAFDKKDIEKMVSRYVLIDPILEQKGIFVNPTHIDYINFTI